MFPYHGHVDWIAGNFFPWLMVLLVLKMVGKFSQKLPLLHLIASAKRLKFWRSAYVARVFFSWNFILRFFLKNEEYRTESLAMGSNVAICRPSLNDLNICFLVVHIYLSVVSPSPRYIPIHPIWGSYDCNASANGATILIDSSNQRYSSSTRDIPPRNLGAKFELQRRVDFVGATGESITITQDTNEAVNFINDSERPDPSPGAVSQIRQLLQFPEEMQI